MSGLGRDRGQGGLRLTSRLTRSIKGVLVGFFLVLEAVVEQGFPFIFRFLLRTRTRVIHLHLFFWTKQRRHLPLKRYHRHDYSGKQTSTSRLTTPQSFSAPPPPLWLNCITGGSGILEVFLNDLSWIFLVRSLSFLVA